MRGKAAAPSGIRVIVCGGRHYDDEAHLFAVLDKLNARRRIQAVITGGASGADTLAERWMSALLLKYDDLRLIIIEPDWARYGRAAGPMRNTRMLAENPNLVIAFPGGSGTRDMIRQARGALVDVRIELR